MRQLFKRMIQGLVLLAVIGIAVGLWKREQIKRLIAVNSLFKEEKIVTNFSNMKTMFLSADLTIGDTRALPFEQQLSAPPEGYDAWVDARNVTSLIVLQDGVMTHEAYFQDTMSDDLRISWSVAKSFLSALMGVVLAEGDIESIDDPVTKYVPDLNGTAYEGASIRDVLQMESGVAFNEDYFDFNSDINRMGRVLALGRTMDGFTTALVHRDAEPGSRWHYVSIDTHVLGMVIRGATGRTVIDLLGEKILTPLGLEAAPYYVTDGEGVAFVLGGLNLRTRDYARFGQMILQEGALNGVQIVPSDWLSQSTVPSALTPAGDTQYGYQWWMPADAREGEFFARGVYGQYIYIDRSSKTVIVATSADRAFRDAGVNESNIEMFRAFRDR